MSGNSPLREVDPTRRHTLSGGVRHLICLHGNWIFRHMWACCVDVDCVRVRTKCATGCEAWGGVSWIYDLSWKAVLSDSVPTNSPRFPCLLETNQLVPFNFPKRTCGDIRCVMWWHTFHHARAQTPQGRVQAADVSLLDTLNVCVGVHWPLTPSTHTHTFSPPITPTNPTSLLQRA